MACFGTHPGSVNMARRWLILPRARRVQNDPPQMQKIMEKPSHGYSKYRSPIYAAPAIKSCVRLAVVKPQVSLWSQCACLSLVPLLSHLLAANAHQLTFGMQETTGQLHNREASMFSAPAPVPPGPAAYRTQTATDCVLLPRSVPRKKRFDLFVRRSACVQLHTDERELWRYLTIRVNGRRALSAEPDHTEEKADLLRHSHDSLHAQVTLRSTKVTSISRTRGTLVSPSTYVRAFYVLPPYYVRNNVKSSL